jgi:segregation and condensation protein B
VHATSAAEEIPGAEDEPEPEARLDAGEAAQTAEPTEVSAPEADTGDEPSAANGSAAAGDADERETSAAEPAADEPAAEAQPQS